MTKAVRTEAGSISHGTCRLEDLIPAFTDELRSLHGDETLIAEAEAVMLLHGLGYGVLSDGEAPYELLNSLQDALGDHAGDGLYFSAHEGDGSDFGFWEGTGNA